MKKLSGNQNAFSLIEMLIVVAILGLVALVAVPSMTSTFRFSVKSAAQEMATLIKDSVNSAQITGKIHRLAFDLKAQQYWVEYSSENTLLQDEDSKKFEKEHKSSFFGTDEEAEEEKKKNGGFVQAKSLTSKKRTLPVGVKIKDILTEQTEAPLTEGMAYIHIFPHGVSEQSLVHLEDTSKNEITLIVTNLLGRATIEGRNVDAKEAFRK